VQRFRGGLVFKAHRLVYHATLGLRVIQKKKEPRSQVSRRHDSCAKMGHTMSSLFGFKAQGPSRTCNESKEEEEEGFWICRDSPFPSTTQVRLTATSRPGGNPGENLRSISHRCHPILVAFVWELTEETIDLHLGCLQGGDSPFPSTTRVRLPASPRPGGNPGANRWFL